MIEHECNTNIGKWIIRKITMDESLYQSMITDRPLKYCPFCGKELNNATTVKQTFFIKE